MAEAQRTYYQHPVPQHVLGVEFKLIGGLTLRQFAYVGGSLVLGYLFYASILPFVIKVPLAAFVVLIGLMLGLVPVNERPLDQYLVNFLTAITSPTERVWVKEPANLDVLFESFVSPQSPSERSAPAKERRDIKEYIKQLRFGQARGPLDLREEEEVKSLDSVFAEVAAKTVPNEAPPEKTAPPTKSYKPFKAERTEVRPTATLASEVNFANEKIISLPTTGRMVRFITPIKNVRAGRKFYSSPTAVGEIVMPIAGEIVLKTFEEETREDLLAKADKTISELEGKIEDLRGTKAPPIESSEKKPEVPSRETLATQTALFNEEIEKLRKQNDELTLQLDRQKRLREDSGRLEEVKRSYEERIAFVEQQNEKLSNEMRQREAELKKSQEKAGSTQTEKESAERNLREQRRRLESLAQEKAESTDEIVRLQRELREARGRAERSAENSSKERDIRLGPAPLTPPPSRKEGRPQPFIKDLPNVINGYVKGRNGLLIRNAVIIIKDHNGDVVRALKTNDLGQFAITTALPNGLYHVEVSAANLAFDIITTEVMGTVLEPMEFIGR